MKILKLTLFIVAISLIFISCERNDPEPDWQAIAFKNNHSWEASAAARVDPKRNNLVSIRAVINNNLGYLREVLVLGFLPSKTGNYILNRIIPNSNLLETYASYTTLSDDGDVIEDRFMVLEEENNFIEIETIDTTNMTMNGKFQVTFIRDPNDYVTNPNLPDTIRFTKGVFNVIIKKY